MTTKPLRKKTTEELEIEFEKEYLETINLLEEVGDMKLLGEIDPKTQEIVAAARKRHRKMINKAESKLETKTALIQALKDADTTYESTLMGLIEFLKQVQEERVRRKAA